MSGKPTRPHWQIHIGSDSGDVAQAKRINFHAAKTVKKDPYGGVLTLQGIGNELIAWAAAASLGTFEGRKQANLMEACAEWPLSALRQLGLQASVNPAGVITTPMGPVGTCFVEWLDDDFVLAQGVLNYALDPSDGCVNGLPCEETETIRSQSGLPLPLVIDRFTRMATILFRAGEAIVHSRCGGREQTVPARHTFISE
ncbi:hypothetical protein [Arthrobacter crystallopoietes]|uniref:hypothetical protein n=1 Tax=Crystallibacter crystallopoietes TaxID=37928 RepID=UPI0011115969|nr:hypothetical protein [Arthrobacter crystallopoietes]